MKHIRTWLAAVGLACGLACSARGAVIYSDDFSGSGAANLHGTAPDVRPGSETWAATTGAAVWRADGSKAGSGNSNAWLPLTPFGGNRYTLSLDVNPNYVAGNADWFALGFSASNSTSVVFQTAPNNAVGWILNRADDNWGTGAFQSFQGPATAGVQNHTIATSGWVNLKVVLDTQPTNWSVEWFINNTSVRGPVAFGTNPFIAYAGFGAYNSAVGAVDNFSLVSDFPYQPPPPMPRYYPMDDNAANTTVVDAAVGVHATYVGANTNARHVPGIIGTGALSLNGTSDYIQLDNSADLNFAASGPFTIGGWVKTTDVDGMVVSFRNSLNGNPLVELGVWGQRPFGQVRDDSGSGLQTLNPAGPSISDDAWHHLAVRRRPDGFIELYLDGMLVATSAGACTGAITTYAQRAVGSERRWVADNHNAPDQRYLAAAVDDVGLWTIALSAQEIALIHALGVFNSTGMDSSDVEALFDAFVAQGAVTLPNGQTWAHTTGLSGPTGAIGGSIAGGDAYVVLNGAAGTGMSLTSYIPEPATLSLLALSALGIAARRSRRRQKR